VNLGLAAKVVLVTGGASGIGAATVTVLAGEGAIPVILDRDPVSEALQEILGDVGHTIRMDLNNDDACAAAVAEVIERFGSIDGLVNNAGSNDGVDLAAGTAAFLASVARNLGHHYAMAHHALPHLRTSRGAIVGVASKTAVTGQGGTSGYVAAKGGVLALMREWATALAADGIRVNAVVPAEVATAAYEHHLAKFRDPEAARAAILRHIPLGHRMTDPHEIADTIVFLLSARATHITGQWIFVDGGYTHLDRALDRDAVDAR
jgi:L-fucose dehydrogenase